MPRSGTPCRPAGQDSASSVLHQPRVSPSAHPGLRTCRPARRGSGDPGLRRSGGPGSRSWQRASSQGQGCAYPGLRCPGRERSSVAMPRSGRGDSLDNHQPPPLGVGDCARGRSLAVRALALHTVDAHRRCVRPLRTGDVPWRCAPATPDCSFGVTGQPGMVVLRTRNSELGTWDRSFGVAGQPGMVVLRTRNSELGTWDRSFGVAGQPGMVVLPGPILNSEF